MAGVTKEDDKENEGGFRQLGPRLVTIIKDKSGYGFTMRNFVAASHDKNQEIELNPDDCDNLRTGGVLMTSQMTSHAGGAGAARGREAQLETMCVKQVRDGSPAFSAGLRAGDRVMSVNGQNVQGKTYSQVIALIQASDQSLKLLVVPKEEEMMPMTFQQAAYNPAKSSHDDPSQSLRAKPPLAPRYKCELRMVPEDGRLAGSGTGSPGPYDGGDVRLAPHRTSATSIASASSSGSYGSSRDPAARLGDVTLNQSHQGHHSQGQGRQQPQIRHTSPNITTPVSNITTPTPNSSQLQSYRTDSRSQYQSTPLSPHRDNFNSAQESFIDSRRKSDGNSSLIGNIPHNSRISHSSLSSTDSGSAHSKQSPVIAPNVPGPRTSSRNITLRYETQRAGSLDSISRSSDSSAGSHDNTGGVRSRTLPQTSAQQAPHPNSQVYSQHSEIRPYHQSYTQHTKRSLDNLDQVHSSSSPSHETMGNSGLRKQRSRSGDRRSRDLDKDDSRSRGNRATEELRRKFFENGLVPPGPGPVYGSHSLSTSALHKTPVTSQHHVTSSQMTLSQRTLPMTSYNSQPDVVGSSRQMNSSDRYHNLRNQRHQSPNNKPSNLLHHSLDLNALSSPQSTSGYIPSSADNYGLTVSISSLGGGSVVDTPRTLQEGTFDHSTPISQSVPHLSYHKPHQRHSLQEQNVVNLVSARMKMFESDSKLDESSHVTDHPDQSGSSAHIGGASVVTSSPYRYGSNSVSSKAAFYERMDRSNDRLASSASSLTHSSAQHTAKGNDDKSRQFLNTKATIPFYFRGAETPVSTKRPSPERRNSQESHPVQGQMGSSPYKRRSRSHSSDRERSPIGVRGGGKVEASGVKTGYDGVRLRTFNEEDRDNKLTRRTSYLLATRQTAVTSDSPTNEEIPSQAQPPAHRERSKLHLTLSPPTLMVGPSIESQSSQSSLTPIQQSPSPSYTLTPSPSQLQPPFAAGGVRLSETNSVPGSTATNILETPQQKTKNIKKLKSFFGERTPKIMEATQQRSLGDAPASPLGDLVLDGLLNCKLAMTDGKRASDRSWRLMWCVLRGHALCLYKDKQSASTIFFEEQPISIKSCIVDIAHHYTKKRHVFRLTTFNGSEYLFQADTHEDMLKWIQAIQDNNNPDQDEAGVSSQDLISRKISKVQNEAPPSAASFQGQTLQGQGLQQAKKAKPAKSLRSKSPAVHSPAPKQKKQASRDEHLESPKVKEKDGNRTWKGKIGKKFKRTGSSSTNPMSENSDTHDANASFGVPLEDCPPSSFRETVPFVVEVCTKFVEAHGLDNQGIYRVPGNTGAVNMLQNELDKGPDNVDFDNEKWLDVNVVSSLLKAFFRKMPEGLISEELYDLMIGANRIENPEKRMLKMKKILHDLPEHNFDTFQYLAEHLYKVQEHQSSNKMDVRNIAIVFGPTLIRTTGDSMLAMVKDMSDQCRIIESIVSYPQWFFGSWDEDVYVPVDQGGAIEAPISGMNQQLINKAENMQLGERGRDFSAKDLVSSVFSAANKKIRRREKTAKGESIDVDFESESSYQERNIDVEIENRIGRVATEAASMIAGTTSGHVPIKPEMTSSKTDVTSSRTMTSSNSGHRLDNLDYAYRTDSNSNIQSQSQTFSNNSSQHSTSNIQNEKSTSVATPQTQQITNAPSQTGYTSRQDIYRAKAAFIQGSDAAQTFPNTSDRYSNSAKNFADTARYFGNARPNVENSFVPGNSYGSSESSNRSESISTTNKHEGTSSSPPSSSANIPAAPAPLTAPLGTPLAAPLGDPRRAQHLRRLEQDQEALRQRQQHEARENSKRAMARHRIEVELMKTRQELENEDDEFIKSTDPASYTYSDYLRSKGGDNTSLISSDHFNTSDYYSTDSSNMNTLESRASSRSKNTSGYPASDYGSLHSPASSRGGVGEHSRENSSAQIMTHSPHAIIECGERIRESTPTNSQQSSRQNSQVMRSDLSQQEDANTGGKFFMLSTMHHRPSPPMLTPRRQRPKPLPSQPPNQQPPPDNSLPRHASYDDMYLYKKQSPFYQTPVVKASNTQQEAEPNSPPFDVTKIVGNSTLQRREKERQDRPHDARHHRAMRKEGTRNRLDSARHGGSLDSLIDSSRGGLDHSRHDSSFYDSGDSEIGDLYQSLMPDFDRRLNDIRDDLEPPPPVPRPRAKTIDSPRAKPPRPRPDSVLLSIGGEKHLVPRELVDKFRDPSLHRVTTPEGSDPQIGIACRFERGGGTGGDSNRANDAETARSVQLRDAKNSLFPSPQFNHQQSRIAQKSSPSHSVVSDPSSNSTDRKYVTFQHRSNSEEGQKRSSVGSTPHSKVYRDSMRPYSDNRDISPSSNYDYKHVDNTASQIDSKNSDVLPASGDARKTRTNSPVALRKRDPAAAARKKREHRRHTVAGTSDSTHLQALMKLTGGSSPSSDHASPSHDPLGPPRPSAWDRLQPMTPVSSRRHTQQAPRDVMTWIHQERLRQARSTSDLLDLESESDDVCGDYRMHEQKFYRHSEQMLNKKSDGIGPPPPKRPTNFDFYKHEKTFSPSEQRQRRRMRNREASQESMTSPASPQIQLTSSNTPISPTSRFSPTSRYGPQSPLVMTSSMGVTQQQGEPDRRSGAFTFESSI